MQSFFYAHGKLKTWRSNSALGAVDCIRPGERFGVAAAVITPGAIRFHMTNAARKLNVTGGLQAIFRAATLGYVGGAPASH